MPKQTAFGGENHYQDFKSEGLRIARENDTESIKRWMEQLLSNKAVSVQQAAAVFHAASDHSPEMFNPFVDDLIVVLKQNAHPAGPRFTYRVLAEICIEEQHLGEIIDLSFRALSDPKSPIAIRVFSMTVISNQLSEYPDLKVELEARLRAGMRNGSAGFISRARKIAKRHGLTLNEIP